jgi:hydrogenase maturation protease
MGASIENDAGVRLLGLGSEILADDAFGILAARQVLETYGGQIEVVFSSAGGFNLLDSVHGASRLIVLDTIFTGAAKPGTIHILREEQFDHITGGSLHYIGLFEILALGRQLELAVPQEVTIIAVEASDCTTVGGAMHPDVQAATPVVVDYVGRLLTEARSAHLKARGEIRHA